VIALLVFTDGRFDYLDRTLTSAETHLKGDIGIRVIVNDAFQDEAHLSHIRSRWPEYLVVTSDHKLGFSGAIQLGWDALRDSGFPITHVFHLEGDFTFNDDVDLHEMARILDLNPELAQLALLRQPWNEEEKAAGGIIQRNPGFYLQTDVYTRHTVCFTTNPCLYSFDLTKLGWPQRQYSEGHFTILLRDLGYHFGYWQDSPLAPPKVHHIGEFRMGTGY
jgi:hypothetical protein